MDPKPPKAGFCPKTDDPPKEDEEAPKAGVEEAPKGELPKAGDDVAPKVGVELKGEEDAAAPNTPVEVPPNMELAVCGAPKGVVVPPKGLGAKGLVLALLVWPKTDWDPNGLLDDCPKGLEPNILFWTFLYKTIN